jgi:hypothetical protein
MSTSVQTKNSHVDNKILSYFGAAYRGRSLKQNGGINEWLQSFAAHFFRFVFLILKFDPAMVQERLFKGSFE